jgi:signal transduction histidine kinase
MSVEVKAPDEVALRAEELYRGDLSRLLAGRDRVFGWLLLGQWALAVAMAVVWSSHVGYAVLVGGFLTVPLAFAMRDSHARMRGVARRQAELELALARVEETVALRTLELERCHDQYRVLVESTKALPWELDQLDLRFRSVGPRLTEFLGILVPDFLAPGFLQANLHPEDRRATLEALDAVARQGSGEIEARLRRGDGRWAWIRFIASSAGVPAERDERDTLTSVIRGMLLDITDARQLELELRQAQKLESVGRLAAGVAHEINTPVQFVSDSIHFVREAMNDLVNVAEKYRVACEAALEGIFVAECAAMARRAEDEADMPYLLENLPKALDRALEGLGRVTTIVRSMKEFAHPDQKEMAFADVNQAIRSTTVIAKNEYKYVADMELELGELPPVKCHLGDLNQVVLNIIVNGAHAIADAVKDTENRGRLCVRTQQEGEMIVIAISDTGGGIPPEVQDRIFDPFFTTKEVGRGTGQGLAIARTVCEKHGGQLTFETLAGRGTTFFIRLPIDGHDPSAEAA